jgi:hypothetical protein
MLFLLPFLVPLITLAAVTVYGGVLSAQRLWYKRGRGKALAVELMDESLILAFLARKRAQWLVSSLS